MKKMRMLAIAVALLVTGSIAFVVCFGKKPYKHLQASDIAAASVRLTPPDETIQITEIKELVEYLNDLVIYQQDDSYQEYAGQAAAFTLTMQDGTQHEIIAYNPFLIIDGTGYKTKYEPCERLNRYANELLSREN